MLSCKQLGQRDTHQMQSSNNLEITAKSTIRNRYVKTETGKLEIETWEKYREVKQKDSQEYEKLLSSPE